MIRKLRDVNERVIVVEGGVLGGVVFTQVLVAVETVIRSVLGRIVLRGRIGEITLITLLDLER